MANAYVKHITGRAREQLSKTKARSRITNGMELLPEVDGRSMWARRMRDLIALHIGDLGGESELSEAQCSLIRRSAALTVELERMELKFAQGEATPALLNDYGRASNTLRRLLESVGLKRIPRDVTPRIADYVASREAAE